MNVRGEIGMAANRQSAFFVTAFYACEFFGKLTIRGIISNQRNRKAYRIRFLGSFFAWQSGDEIGKFTARLNAVYLHIHLYFGIFLV